MQLLCSRPLPKVPNSQMSDASTLFWKLRDIFLITGLIYFVFLNKANNANDKCVYHLLLNHQVLKIVQKYDDMYLLFWYHVLTWVSDRPSLVANSSLSWTLRYFCLAKCFSRLLSCWSVKAVLAFRGFFNFEDDIFPYGV